MKSRPPIPFGLTPTEFNSLVYCYHEGHSQEQAAEWLRITQPAVTQAIESAKAKIVALGMPEPKPHGQHSREELRRAMPVLFRRLTHEETYVQCGAVAAGDEPY